MKKTKKVLVGTIVILAIAYIALEIIYYFTPKPEDIIEQKFIENEIYFNEIVEYYESLEYSLFLKNCSSGAIIESDNIQYKVDYEDGTYLLKLHSDSYEKFNDKFLSSGQNIEQVIGNFKGISVTITKETFQLLEITIDISDSDSNYYSLLRWYKQENLPDITADYMISLVNNWYILRWGYT